MKRVLIAAALLALLPTAHAQDKGKTDFTTNGEFRVRDTFEQNESGNSNQKPSHHNGIEQRFNLGLGMKVNEKFNVKATFIEAGQWGQNTGEIQGDRSGTGGVDNQNNNDLTNFMSVNEAYAGWMISDDFSAKFGRQNFAFGDGSVMSVNDWQQHPYSFDGVTGKYEADWGRFNAFAFKYRDFSIGGNTATTSDPQHDAYGLVFDLKNMPEVLKMVNAYIIQDTADGVSGATAGANTVMGEQNQNALRYGALAALAFGQFDVKGGYNMVSGNNSDFGAATSRKINENMMQAEVGFTLPNVMASRLWINYHRDSGTSAGNQNKEDDTYDPYFYDLYAGSGPMQIIAWGNLTDISAGWNLKPMDTTDVGISYHMFSRTNTDDGIHTGLFGNNLRSVNLPTWQKTGIMTVSDTDSAIGQEADVWAEHHYDGGLSMLARVGYFMPGAALKNNASPNNMPDSILQVQVQGKLTF